jgi:preprotein translocase subunit SecA
VSAARQAGREAFQAKLDYFKEVEAKVGAVNLGGQALSHIVLTVIDEKWKDHLYDLDQLRAAIIYRQWGQKDPLVEYKSEAYEMFVGLMKDVYFTLTERWLKLQIEIGPPRAPGRTTGPAGGLPARRSTPMVATKPAADGLVSGGTAVASATAGGLPPPPAAAANAYAGVGRNDPCPCGSGKKFKKCHGAGR